MRRAMSIRSWIITVIVGTAFSWMDIFPPYMGLSHCLWVRVMVGVGVRVRIRVSVQREKKDVSSIAHSADLE